MIVYGRPLQPGVATAVTVRLRDPISFWGGVDEDGTVIDRRHAQFGTVLAGRVLLMSSGRGSSSSSSVLAELIRAGNAPAAIVLARSDAIIVLGAIVARELYGQSVPVIVVPEHEHRGIPDHRSVTVTAGTTGATLRWDDR